MISTEPISVAVVGVGEIARKQHLPAIENSGRFALAAVVNREVPVDGVVNYSSLERLLSERPDISALALCTPPQVRFELAWMALQAGRHVLLEKPPGATLSEVESLKILAAQKGLTLLAAWHSRHAPAVETARSWLQGRLVKTVDIVWKEDVRRWHPGQAWIWQAGGAGIFDPGINALSILTHVMPHGFRLTDADLEIPENCETPIAARLHFSGHDGADISADFDWRQEGPQTWDILFETSDGSMRLSAGGSIMHVDGKLRHQAPDTEYESVYSHFATLLAAGRSDVDTAPLRHVADAFMLGHRHRTDPFHE